MKINKLIFCLIIITWSFPTLATDGYFMIGYGAKAIGVGGAGVAHGQDRLAGAINPATMADSSGGYDVGLRFMLAVRKASLDCRGIFGCDRVVKDRSSREFFVAPNFGWSRKLGDDLTFGVSVYANGGINTNYGRAFYAEAAARIMGGTPDTPGFPRTGKLGIDFSQLFIAPSIAWQFRDGHTVGLSPIMAIQRFSTRGFELFESLSADPSSVTGRSTDYTLGGGVRVGWTSDLGYGVRFGAQYTSRVWTRKSTKYNGLLANNGELDAPPHWTVGLSWAATERVTLLFDFQRILFDSVDAISNPGPTAAELAGFITPDRMLGGGDGIGFGWRDQSVFKLGLIIRANDRLTVRAGWNHASSQIPNRETLINIPAPATINDNASLGASWKFTNLGELSFSYQHAFKKTAANRNTNFFGAAARAAIIQDYVDIAWARNF